MKNDLIFSCIALPFTIGFGMASSRPLWALAVFAAMLLLRYTAAPATSIAASRRLPGGVSDKPLAVSADSNPRYRGQRSSFGQKIAPLGLKLDLAGK